MQAAALVLSLLSASTADVRFPPIIDLAQTSADVTILGAAAYEYTGARFTCGDYNGDGLLDLVVLSMGRPGSDGYPFFHILWGGSPLPSTVDLAAYTSNVSYVRAMAGDNGSLAQIESGDINGDGIDDVALGIPCTGFNCAGKVYIITGAPSFPDTLNLGSTTSTLITVLGSPGGRGFGGALGYGLAVGDIDGDLIDDLVMSAPEMLPGGHVYVLWGQRAMLPTVELGDPTTNVTRMIDSRYDHRSGVGLASGDANGDGLPDVLIGGGDAMLVLGASSLVDTIPLPSPAAKRFYTTEGGIGTRVKLADFDGDGYRDIVISSVYASPLGCEECGEVIVAYGASEIPEAVLISSPDAPVSRFLGVGVAQLYGVELAHGDVNGDEHEDILISSRPDNYDQADVGKVTVVYGSAAPPDTILLGSDARVTRVYAEWRTDDFGMGLISCDINMDGVDDVIVGARRADASGRTAAGKAYILFGRAESTGSVRSPHMVGHLRQNYPNPFNPLTFIPLYLEESQPVRLRIYDAAGRPVRTLVDRELERGEHAIPWNGIDDKGDPVASGVYFYRLSGPSFVEVRKMVLVR